jgi:template-activating factor I
MSNSKKRSSPGADTAKNGDPFADVDIGDAEESILTEYQKKIQRVELILGGQSFVFLRSHEHVVVGLITNSLAERRAQEQLTPVYQQRREALKSIPKFWPVALLKHSLFALEAQHDGDRLALSYLEDVWVVRDPREPKVFTLEFVRRL